MAKKDKEKEPKGAKKAAEEDSGAYRRRRRPVRVRRGLADWRSWPWLRIGLAGACLVAAALAVSSLRTYLTSAPRFALSADDGILITGVERLDEAELRRFFSGDEGANILSVPIAERRVELLSKRWVRDATISRRWPNRIWVHIEERNPAAYVRIPEGPRGALTLRMIDDEGVLLEPLEGPRLELPVVDGLTSEVPQEERAARIALLDEMLRELDGDEPAYGDRLSQIDLSEPKNVRVTTVHEGDVIELQLGDELFRHRFGVFDEYIAGWKREFGTVGWVDLRFEDQVIVLPLNQTAKVRR